MALFGRPDERDERREEAYRLWVRQRNPYAIASMVLGIFSLIELGANLVFGVAGIVVAVVALKQLSLEQPRWPKGKRLAWGGIVLSGLSLVLAACIYLVWRHGR